MGIAHVVCACNARALRCCARGEERDGEGEGWGGSIRVVPGFVDSSQTSRRGAGKFTQGAWDMPALKRSVGVAGGGRSKFGLDLQGVLTEANNGSSRNRDENAPKAHRPPVHRYDTKMGGNWYKADEPWGAYLQGEGNPAVTIHRKPTSLDPPPPPSANPLGWLFCPESGNGCHTLGNAPVEWVGVEGGGKAW